MDKEKIKKIEKIETKELRVKYGDKDREVAVFEFPIDATLEDIKNKVANHFKMPIEDLPNFEIKKLRSESKLDHVKKLKDLDIKNNDIIHFKRKGEGENEKN